MHTSEIPNLLFKFCQALPKTGGARVGACIIYKRRIIAFGRNQYKSHPLQREYGRNEGSIFLHAELHAIVNCSNNSHLLNRSYLFVCRVLSSRSRNRFIFGLAKPCSGCMRAIRAFNIPKVYYSDYDQKFHRLEI